jgi:hypothetical protein
MKKIMITGIATLLIVAAYEYIVFKNVGVWDDLTKLVFASLLNPFLWEIPLTLTRAAVRTLGFNHSSTNYVLVAWVVSCKKATGRFVLSTIVDATYVTIASVVLSCAEVFFVVTVGARDRTLYRRLCVTPSTVVRRVSRRFSRRISSARVDQPTDTTPAKLVSSDSTRNQPGFESNDPRQNKLAAVKHKRNTKLRSARKEDGMRGPSEQRLSEAPFELRAVRSSLLPIRAPQSNLPTSRQRSS